MLLATTAVNSKPNCKRVSTVCTAPSHTYCSVSLASTSSQTVSRKVPRSSKRNQSLMQSVNIIIST